MSVLIVRNVPDDLKKQFKIICMQDDTTMSAEVIGHMKEIVKAGKLK